MDFSVTSMCIKLILKFFVRLLAFCYKESLIKLQGKEKYGGSSCNWSGFGKGEMAKIWLVPLGSGPAVTGKRGIPAKDCVLQQQETRL